MRIGITERGDAALDLSWTNKISNIDGAILITKAVSSVKFQNAVKEFKDKVIIHATITGFGGTPIEPNVPTYEETLNGLYELESFMPEGNIVLRIDPIIPNEAGRSWIHYLIKNIPVSVKRIRFSIIDNYKHILQRGLELPWSSFHAPPHLIADVVNDFMPYSHTHYIECCGEDHPLIPEEWKRGCISDRDVLMLRLDINKIPKILSGQRKSCKCLSIKTELLNNKGQCKHGCLYCYWR